MCSCEEDWKWTATTLSRTCDQAQQVLKRSLLRKFSYPPAKAMSSNEVCFLHNHLINRPNEDSLFIL